MSLTPLCNLALKYGTDKQPRHNYTPTYYALLKDRALSTKRVLEIGIKLGASLYMWQDFFPNAQIFGFDFKPQTMIHSGRIKSFLGSQDNRGDLLKAAASGPFDLIVDDGSHRPAHQLFSALILLPHLAKDGIYVIEDVQDRKIVEQIPAAYRCEIVVMDGKNFDSVLVVIRKTQ